MAKIKGPTEINQRAKSIVDIATGEVAETKETDLIKLAASAMGKRAA